MLAVLVVLILLNLVARSILTWAASLGWPAPRTTITPLPSRVTVVGASQTNPLVEEDDLELETDPLVGWKVARLAVSDDGREVRFVGVGAGGAYGAVDEARCVRVPTHRPPEPGCRCGFYVWKDHDRAAGSWSWRSPALVLARVEGRFDEYALGYVGERQIVLAVQLWRWCATCAAIGQRSAATTLVAVREHGAVRGFRRWLQALPSCDLHATNAPVVIRPDRLADLLGVEVRVGDAPAGTRLRAAPSQRPGCPACGTHLDVVQEEHGGFRCHGARHGAGGLVVS